MKINNKELNISQIDYSRYFEYYFNSNNYDDQINQLKHMVIVLRNCFKANDVKFNNYQQRLKADAILINEVIKNIVETYKITKTKNA